ncbi:MAG: DM13 domain-containing protein [Pseudomonadota bacterium]
MRTLALAIAATSLLGAAAPAAFAQETAVQASAAAKSGEFVKKRKKLRGNYTIIEENGQRILRFSDDFRAAGGPDLKVFLSPTAFGSVNGKNAVNGSINLGELQSTKGSQDYVIPASVDLNDFESVLVHCEAYAVLWGGASL